MKALFYSVEVPLTPIRETGPDNLKYRRLEPEEDSSVISVAGEPVYRR